MDTPVVSAPQPTPTQPQGNETPQTAPPTKPPSNPMYKILLGFFGIILFAVLCGGAYMVGAGKLTSFGLLLVTPPTPTPSLVKPTEPVMPTGVVSVTTPTSTLSASVTTTITPKPTIAPNTDGNTFSSDKLGVTFYYAKSMGYDKNTTIKILDTGPKMYIYEASMKPETGQSVERFDKSPTDTLAQAITKKFLNGIPATDCFVKIDVKKPTPTMTKATISYPIPANADQPNFTYGEKCPEHYSESNGMAYFLEDATYPDRFYFVNIGQYGIPAYNTKPDSAWQDTITVF